MASRRQFLETVGAAAAAIAAAGRAHAQTPSQPPAAPPPRDFGPSALPAPYPDPDLLVVDPEFGGLRLGNTPIKRLWTGALWAEGPAWSSEGRELVWSDVAGNRQYRWIE